jgi:uncharacterized damage-inducible protein DinB
MRRLTIFSVLVAAAGAAAIPLLATPVAQAPNPISASVRQGWQAARLNIKESADLLPVADFTFRPVDSVRTFGQLFTHVAGANYVFCAAAKGEPPPHAEDAFENTVTERAEIIRVLAESLAYCDAAYDEATDRSLADMVAQPFGGGTAARAGALMGNVSHLNEHYGNLVTYFRMRGIVPPSSRR